MAYGDHNPKAEAVAAIVADVVTATPSPTRWEDLAERDRGTHDRVRERLGLTREEYLARFVKADDLTEAAELAAIASASRKGARK